jgi:hypothetical protein
VGFVFFLSGNKDGAREEGFSYMEESVTNRIAIVLRIASHTSASARNFLLSNSQIARRPIMDCRRDYCPQRYLFVVGL